jgi:hypothetical protein
VLSREASKGFETNPSAHFGWSGQSNERPLLAGDGRCLFRACAFRDSSFFQLSRALPIEGMGHDKDGYYAGTESLVLSAHGKTSGRYAILLMNSPGPARAWFQSSLCWLVSLWRAKAARTKAPITDCLVV